MDIVEFYKTVGGDYWETLDRLMAPQLIDKYVRKFGEDSSYPKLVQALENEDIENAFRAVHTLKGTAGTLGLQSLFEEATILAEMFRPDRNGVYGNLSDIDYTSAYERVSRAHDIVLDAISRLD